MQAKDVMAANVISVSEGSPIHEVVGLLLKYRISAVPVVDSTQRVVGIVSEGDLLRPEGTARGGIRNSRWLEAFFSPVSRWRFSPVSRCPTKGHMGAPPAR